MNHPAAWSGVALFAGLLLSPSISLAAQDSAGVSVERRAVIRALHVGQRLRIEQPGGARLEGVFSSVTRDSLVVAGDVGLAQLSDSDIDKLWVRGRATKTGAIIGGIVGLLAGVGYGLLLGEVICNNEDCNADTGVVVAVLGLGGAAVGAGGGAVIGAAIPKWHLRFP
jgi:hypothetical protein